LRQDRLCNAFTAAGFTSQVHMPDRRSPAAQEAHMRTLLVPIDGSECSARALDHAIVLARERGDFELHLLNVNPDPIVYGEIQVYETLERIREHQRAESESLLEPAAAKARAAAIPCRTEADTGDAATVIARRADDMKCDGVVMGTRGMGKIANLLLGSVAAKVVHLSDVPVTLVK
jgi:nucleotide-binding universal stress UspA family protein